MSAEAESIAVPVRFVAQDEGGWLAQLDEVSEYGEGLTPAEALQDLMRNLEDYLAFLRGERDNLSARLQGHLAYLERTLAFSSARQ
jgi:hypothetical protein